MKNGNNDFIGQVLVREGIVSGEQLQRALREQRKNSGFIGTILVRLGFAEEEKIYQALAEHLSIPFVRLKSRDIPTDVIRKVPAKIASHYKIIPITTEDHTLTVATTNPADIQAVDDIGLLIGMKVKAVMAGEKDLQEAMRKYYGIGAETLERMAQDEGIRGGSVKADVQTIQDLETLPDDASIVTFVNQILTEAIKDRATDIHLEPFADELRTRFRIDGILYNIKINDTIRYFHPAIVSRIKIMANLNIAERRLPQDGRIKIKLNGTELDLRVSIIPTTYNEAVHIRILSTKQFLNLENLGLREKDLAILERVIKKTHGVVFVTGPTGSGKSTTLYACLARINNENIKIITIEDPVEYQLKGVNQVQVHTKIGLDFTTGLRHLLRHDPDVMMIGEVRDCETAEIAIRAALTGHLLFSTLHTNDAAGAVTRLLDMNIEPFLVSSSLECLIAQRLVRLICPHCKTARKPNEEILRQISNYLNCENTENIHVYEGEGCEECRYTGYHGRTAIYEILPVTQAVRDLILARASSQQIKEKAVQQGMRTLRQDGLEKVLAGFTTYSEVMRVTQQEELLEE
jgi:type II secretion system protein E